MTSLRIHLFGGLTVENDGAPLPKLVSRKADMMLAYLAHEQQPCSRETIATLLWEDRTQKQSMSNLRTLISSLRKHADDFVTITRKTAVINQPVWVDTAVFQQQLALADDNWPHKDAIAQAEAALALYRGEFLDGVLVDGSFELESWMQTTRDRLRHLAVGTRQKLVAHYLREGEYAAGIQHAIALLQDDPLDESAHRQMMQLLAKSGQRSAAMAQYETCRRLLDDELGVEPDEETEALWRRIELADSEPITNLPAPLTTFVGRAKERQEVAELLRDDACRLLTLIGLGGIGKTRLAIRIGHDVAENYLNGVYFVPLAPLESESFIVSAIAEATQLTFSGNADPKTQLFNHLRQKEALLIFDNFEHLLSGARLLDEILRHAPDVNLLVTSRERLQLRAEWLFELGGLACLPPTAISESMLPECDSQQLFSDRARLVDVNFELTAVNYNCVAQICNLLQGMPLGIELAAAWARAFSCDQILMQIEQNISFLATQMQDIPARHRSLRAVFDYVWELLSPDERLLFVKLSLFRGGFTIQAATAVANVSPWTLVALVEKSLLRKRQNGRYEMLEMLRRFAATMGATMADEIAEGRARHADYYADFILEYAPLLNGRRTKEGLSAITIELENVHAAWSYAIVQADFGVMARLLLALQRYYIHKGPFQEGLELVETAVNQFQSVVQAIAHPTPAQADLLSELYAAQANLNELMSNYDEAITAAKEAIRWGEIGQNDKNQAVGYQQWGWNCSRKGEYNDAIVHAQKGLDMAQRLGEKREEAACSRVISIALVRQGHYVRAAEYAQRARVLFREAGDDWGEARALNMLGIAYWYLGDYDKSRAYYQQALPIYQEVGNTEGENSVLGNLGLVAAYHGNYEEATRLYKQVLNSCRRSGNRWNESWVLNNLSSIALDLNTFEEAMRYGRESVRLAAKVNARWLEMTAVHNIGASYWYMGEYAQAETYYQQSNAIQDVIKETHGKGIILRDFSMLAYAQEEYETALTYAQQSVTIGENSDDSYALAMALTAVGDSLAALGKLEDARMAYARALPILATMKQPHQAINTQAGLLKIELAQGNMAAAMALTDAILAHFAEHSINGIMLPFSAYLACVQALQAADDSRASTVLAEAKKLLEETAVSIQNPSLRDSYLQNVTAHRELMG